MRVIKVTGILSGLGIGWFLLLANPVKAQSSTVHQLGILESADPTLSDGSYFDSYEIAGSAGQRVTISLDSSEFDTFLGLIDSEGNLIANNNDASDSNPNSFTSIVLPNDGIYTVVATSYQPSVNGGYRLTMRNFSPPPAASDTSYSSGIQPVYDSFLLTLMGAAVSEMLFGGPSPDETAQEQAAREQHEWQRYVLESDARYDRR